MTSNANVHQNCTVEEDEGGYLYCDECGAVYEQPALRGSDQ